jgi:hypothetical protein
MDHLIKDSLCGNCIKELEKVKSFKEWVELDEAKNFKKVAAKAGKKYGSKKSGAAVAGAAMWKAARKAGASFSKVAKAARKGEDIDLKDMKKFK